ncbi:uncharacterized protein A4U43_C08F29190 [Asparagus officinalis]|nr:uncharacterized protein A4U43_C08F29190 [Asparagus officinalis]
MTDFLLSLVTPVVEKLRDFLIGRVMLTIRVGDNVSALDHQVEILKQKRQDVEGTIERDEPAGRVATNEVKGWLQNAEELEKEAAAVSNKYKERNCRFPGGCSFNCWLSHSVSAEAVDVKTKVEAELQRIEHIQRTEYPPPPCVQEVPTTALGSDTGSEIRSKVDKALNFLRNDNQAVLGIWGMGGVGKTTVLQHINNALATANGGASIGFHRVVFVTASRGCTVEKIQKQVAKELQLPEGGDHGTNIFNFLNKRSFVVLLDDLWESLDLKQVGLPPLGAFGELKHKLILTTRDRQVCLDMGADPIESVSCLDADKARRLFREKVGEGVISSHPLISDLADKIADECGGRRRSRNQHLQLPE